MPSADAARPGLIIRDPYQYSGATLIVPPPLVQVLECFDGEQSTIDLRSELVRITGEIQVGDLEKHLFDSLNEAGFLDNDRYHDMKSRRESEFALEQTRPAVFSGSAYPENAGKLSELLDGRIGRARGDAGIIAIAAPHASPDAGWETYRAAYQALPSRDVANNRTFIVLGTSHYGAPDRFGLTRKQFVTPFGVSQTDLGLVDELEREAADAIRMEDYCHAVEHSIEFQIVFLQYLYGAAVRILPILCGPFVKSIYEGGMPEDSVHLARFFDALGNIAAREGERLFFVIGVDMAHMGPRYHDRAPVTANSGEMLQVQARDRGRIERVCEGDALAYWSLVQEKHDDLKWCGASPIYTFLKALPAARGELNHYHQWQIDPHSVVTFGAMHFRG